MDPARWQRLEQLCFEALEHDPAARLEWLQAQCGGDAALHAEAVRLLGELDRDPGFLERPLLHHAGVDLSAPPDPPPPETIGVYRIQHRLGRGGMGEVYLATRDLDGVPQHVAIKVVRPGMGTAEILERFRQERRILAGLDHPNIARLLDAGATPEGSPYFVLEHVDGIPVDAYCDQHQLSIEHRLQLFQTVCQAVEHAHQRLVVHRDLKPGNILVTGDGVVKLLDFGIGKLLAPGNGGDEVIETRSQVRLLTPEYAAPEQVAGGTITTTADVYALGVLLYELLSGHHPYREPGAQRADLERAVLETTPRRPSTVVTTAATSRGDQATVTAAEIGSRRRTDPDHLRRRLAGDLDNIVLKALRKEPDRRYASAAALSDDLQRHLDGHPVRARSDTLAYRASKFVTRNAGWVTAAGVAFLALGTTAAVTLVQSRRVAVEAARVTEERDKALEVRSFLMEMFGASGANQATGDTVSVRRLLDLQAASLETTFADRPELRAEMLEVLADGYDRLGLIQSAQPLAERALALRRELLPPDDPGVGPALNLMGWITHELGRSAEAEPILREAVAIRRGAGPRYREDLARSLNDLGVVLNALARYHEADTVLTEALEIRLATLGPGHRAVGITGNNLAAAYYFLGRLPDAIRVQEVAVEAIRSALGTDHQRTVVAMSNLASFRRTNGDWPAAEATYRELLAIQMRLQGADHPVTARTRTQVAQVMFERGLETGDAAALVGAEEENRAAVATFEAALGAEHPQVGVALSALSLVLTERDLNAEALPIAERSLSILEKSLGRSNPNTLPSLARLARIRWRLGQVEPAIALQREALLGYLSGPGTATPETARAQAALCEFLLIRGGGSELREAAELCSSAGASLDRAPPGVRRNAPYVYLRLVQVYRAQGRTADADSLLTAIRPRVDSIAGLGGQLRSLLDSLLATR